MATKTRYNPRRVESALTAALRCSDVQYVYATGRGWAVDAQKPLCDSQAYYRVSAGVVEFVEPPKPWVANDVEHTTKIDFRRDDA